ncbi:PilN domain-containing protein [Uliginosibacterium sp. 31-12]|uniref:PilN domain-containing protein n=1 Tax=Uliginosibacterium sp. 31-12 TaxID=3062781 RepID=UPI0026E3C60E|nr:PilN domain-containing protein [Uliginosibacterium sp. 31-12]MDO6384900.1 PilN domain-containing protein [Uliginosibacterium sp. 31-12]
MKAFINLANPALLPPKPFFQFRTMMLALGLVLLMLIGLSSFIRWSLASYLAVAQQAQLRVTAREAQLKAQQALLTVREKSPQVTLDLAAAHAETARLRQIAVNLAGQEGGPQASASLAALSSAVLPGVWLEQVAWQRGAVSLQGYALRAPQVPEYLERLRSQEAFRKQRFEMFELGRKQFPAPAGVAAPEALAFSLQARTGSGRP